MEGTREAFRIRLHREYLQFKESMLLQDRLELYECCYRIDVYRNLYEIMSGLAERMPVPMLEALYGKENLLGWLYESWIKVDDSYYGGLRWHVERTLLDLGLHGKDGGADGRDEDREAADGRGD